MSKFFSFGSLSRKGSNLSAKDGVSTNNSSNKLTSVIGKLRPSGDVGRTQTPEPVAKDEVPGSTTTTTTKTTDDGVNITTVVTKVTKYPDGSSSTQTTTSTRPSNSNALPVPAPSTPEKSASVNVAANSSEYEAIVEIPTTERTKVPVTPPKSEGPPPIPKKTLASMAAIARIAALKLPKSEAPASSDPTTPRDTPPRHHATSAVSRQIHGDALDKIISNRAIRDESYSGARLHLPDMQSEFDILDRYAKNSPTFSNIASLADYLSKSPVPEPHSKLSDLHILRLVYSWISTHIQYDVAALRKVFKPNIVKVVGGVRDLHTEEKTAELAFSAGKAVCDGYADLFCDLSKRLGFNQCWKVVGGSKGSNHAAGDAFADPNNHAWNVVLVRGEYRFMDATWGAGIVDGKFTFHFEPGYFLVRPKHFIFTHFPVDPVFQYLENPLTIQEFIHLPKIHPGYLQSTAKLITPRGENSSTPLLSYIEVSDQPFKIEIEFPNNEILAPGTSWKPSATFIFPAGKRSPPPPLNATIPLVWTNKVNQKSLNDQIIKSGGTIPVVTTLRPSDDNHHVLTVTGSCPAGGDGILSISIFDLEKSKALRTYKPDGSYTVSFNPQSLAKSRYPPYQIIRNLIDFRIRNCGTGRFYVAPVKQMDTGSVMPLNAEFLELVSPMESELQDGVEYDFLVDVTYPKNADVVVTEGPILGLLIGSEKPVDMVVRKQRSEDGKKVVTFGLRAAAKKGRVMIGLITTTRKVSGAISFGIKGVAVYNAK